MRRRRARLLAVPRRPRWDWQCPAWPLCLCCFCCLAGSLAAPEPAPGYLVAVPSIFRSGVEESVSVTIFHPTQDTSVQVQLIVRDKATIKLKVPPGLRGQAYVKVWGNQPSTVEGYAFHNHTTVTIDSKGASVFIQMDKPVYMPKQKVLINLFTVNPDLRPVNERVEAYVVDPRGSRMIEWNNLKPVCCGILNMSFPLSDQPVFGEWHIFAEMQGNTYSKSFEVQKYVLPKFEVRIDPPRYIRDLRACEKGTVHARYTFGKSVSGRLVVNMTVNGVGYYRHEAGHPVLKSTEIDGSVDFDICVRDMMPADIPEHFRGTVSIWAMVTSMDGSQQVTFDDSTPVQKQLVDIRYTKDTRKQFKPGLPYKGKVEITYPDGSPADGVTVRIKAELTPKDNIYTSELRSRGGGRVEFEIPSIPSAAQYVWLETKVIAVDGKPAGDHYLPNYLSISSWYSPSKCYLQLQMPDKPFLPIAGRFLLTFGLNVELLAAGRASTGPSLAERKTCTTSVRFPVTANMAPLGRLLVYYVRVNGEGVTDSLQFSVKPSFENQVSVVFSANETRPGDSVVLKIQATKGSCVCVAAVDKSVYLLKPGFQLTAARVFQEMAEYDVSEAFGTAKDDGHFWWPGMSSRQRRSSIFPWHWDITKDARFAFTETGLVVMTDLVSLNHRQQGGMYTDEAGPAFQPHTGTLVASVQGKASPRADKRRRTFFPETWLWHCVNISSSGDSELHVDVPDSITTWLAEAVALSAERGLGLATQVRLRTFKPFFVEFTLPQRVIRGEQTKIPLMVHNYLPTCLEVHAKVSVPKGIKFVGHPGWHHLTRKKCVAPGKALPVSVVLAFSELGPSNIAAKALAYSANCCQENTPFPKPGKHPEDTPMDKQAPLATDYVRRSIIVEPEGLTREYTYSVFFCPNEKIHISTPNKYEFQYVQKPARMVHFEVSIKAHNNAHVALSSSPHDMAEMTEIVIGGHQNRRTWISTSKMGEPVASAETAGILSWDEFRTFWISWANGLIQVGCRASRLNDSLLVSWAAPKPPEVRYVGFSTGWGSVGEFRIWRKEEADENHNEAFTLGIPHNVIPGSERATASVIGDVMGPTLNNLDNLLQLPSGCGEQNMIHFAPNVFVLKYLQKTKQLSPEVESEATDFLVQGYQRQLTYRRQDGSYSAFGERDSSGSMWLTAFVLKSFAQSRGFIFIDPKELWSAKDWIIRHQNEDGSFPAMGRILNKDIQGGVHGKISLTAYVVAALLETGVTSEEEKSSVARARRFLEANVYSAEDPYTTILTAYTLTLLTSLLAPAAVRKMNGMAIAQDGFTHWSLMGTLAAAEDTFMGFNDGLSQSVSAEVEMTAYALLTYTVLGDVASALPVVKWLSQQRNALGGFSSTQDTCVALQALAEYAILSYIGGVNLTISLASTNLDYQETFELNRANKKLLQTTEIPSIPTGLFVSAKGEGCCLLQIDVVYNVPDPVAKPAFQLLVNLQEPKPKRHRRAPRPPPEENRSETTHGGREVGDDDDPVASDHRQEYKVIVEVCMRWLHSGSSNMAVLEVPLFSGFRADVESLEQLLLNKQIGLKRYDLDGRKVLFYFDEMPSQCLTCIKFVAFREYIVGKTAPVPVKVYDYYEPAFEAIRFYNVSENSPLARELCDGPMCNEVESAASHGTGFVHGGPCSGIFGCPEEGYFEQCLCSRDCGYDGDPVCGSDGLVYQNHCQMEVSACRNNTQIEQVPMAHCAPAKASAKEKTPHPHSFELLGARQPVPTDEGPTLPLEFSYYSYDYDLDPYAPEGDALEMTTVTRPAEQGAAATVGE